jgi:hypothetical protein
MKLLVLACIPLVAADLGKSTYAMSHPFAYKAFAEKYLPTAENMVQDNSTSSCVEWVKLCIDDGHMTACSGPQGNFQMHSVGAYKRDSGSKSMEQIETEWTKSMGAMNKFDPFFDYNVGFVTTDLDSYISAFDKDKVPYFASTFTDAGTQKKYKSILVQIPGSLAAGAKSILSVELMAESSLLLSSRAGVHHHSLPRATPTGLARAEAHLAAAPRKLASNGMPVITRVHLSFASSDLDRDSKYFEGVWQGKKVYEASTPEGKMYAGKLITSDGAEFIYRQTSTPTQGPTTVAQWEAYQSGLHKKCFVPTQNEGFDRLADNHGGHAMGQLAYLDDYIKAQKAAGLPYRFYGGGGGSGAGGSYFFYLYGPNGWGLQIISSCQDASLCPSSSPGGYNMCTQGITGKCSKDQPAAIVV